jgi:hypothetical protein
VQNLLLHIQNKCISSNHCHFNTNNMAWGKLSTTFHPIC